MIFGVDENTDILESYKERNLYYKFFAGYFFNELIEGFDNRRDAFFQLLSNALKTETRYRGNSDIINQLLGEIKMEDIVVTFDYHSAQIIKEHKKEDRGEMSDVLLISKSVLVSIECKFLEDMKFGKDISEVQNRIEVVSKKLHRKPLQILLMLERKWEGTIRSNKKRGSFFNKFRNNTIEIPVLIIIWEELRSLINDEKVLIWFDKQLKRVKRMTI